MIYVIRAGDTLFRLAQRFNTTVAAILRANPGLDPNRLMIGQQICIPGIPVPTCPGGTLYTIRAGDTLFSIARRFNTTVEAILRANPGLDPNRLMIGQQICIPGIPVPTCPGGTFYTIRAGDTLFSIARRFNTTVEAILRANPGLDPNRLMIGQQICIPGIPVPTCPDGTFYTIRAGDTLFSIARRFNTTVEAILRANPGLDPNRLVIGQQICIPGPVAPPPPPPGPVTIRLNPSAEVPTARGTVVLDPTTQTVTVRLRGVPDDPAEVDVGADVYRVWVRRTRDTGWEFFDLRFRPDTDVWAGRTMLDEPVENYSAVEIRAEEETNRTAPMGTLVASAEIEL